MTQHSDSVNTNYPRMKMFLKQNFEIELEIKSIHQIRVGCISFSGKIEDGKKKVPDPVELMDALKRSSSVTNMQILLERPGPWIRVGPAERNYIIGGSIFDMGVNLIGSYDGGPMGFFESVERSDYQDIFKIITAGSLFLTCCEVNDYSKRPIRSHKVTEFILEQVRKELNHEARGIEPIPPTRIYIILADDSDDEICSTILENDGNLFIVFPNSKTSLDQELMSLFSVIEFPLLDYFFVMSTRMEMKECRDEVMNGFNSVIKTVSTLNTISGWKYPRLKNKTARRAREKLREMTNKMVVFDSHRYFYEVIRKEMLEKIDKNAIMKKLYDHYSKFTDLDVALPGPMSWSIDRTRDELVLINAQHSTVLLTLASVGFGALLGGIIKAILG